MRAGRGSLRPLVFSCGGLALGLACFIVFGAQPANGLPEDDMPRVGEAGAGGVGEAPDGSPPRPDSVVREPDTASPGNEPAAHLRRLAFAELSCVAADSRVPLAGVSVFDATTRRELATTDDEGRAELRSVVPAHLMLGGEGVFFALLSEPDKDALARSGKVEVSVIVDRFSLALDLVCEWPDGIAPETFELVLRPRPGRIATGSFPRARVGEDYQVSPELDAAWRRHRMLAGQAAKGRVTWHLTAQALPYVLPARGARIRLADPGPWLLEARSGALVASASIDLAARAVAEQTLRFAEGAKVELRLRGSEGAPLAGARVQLEVPGLVAEGVRELRSDREGRVVFDGLPRSARGLKLGFEADGYEPLEREFTAGRGAQDVTLRARARLARRLRIVEAASGDAIAGARVELGARASAVTSDAKGVVELAFYADEDRVVTINARGYLRYREQLRFVEGAAFPERFTLVPSDPERQLALGLVCQVEGRILDRAGKPRVGELVLLERSPFEAVGGTRPRGLARLLVLEGATPRESLRVATDAEGRFRILTTRGGDAVLRWSGGKAKVFAQLGRRIELEL